MEDREIEIREALAEERVIALAASFYARFKIDPELTKRFLHKFLANNAVFDSSGSTAQPSQPPTVGAERSDTGQVEAQKAFSEQDEQARWQKLLSQDWSHHQRPDRGGPEDPDSMVHQAIGNPLDHFIFKLIEIHSQRGAKYQNTQWGHEQLAKLWSNLLEQFFGRPLPRQLNARMVFVLLAASKLNRICVDPLDLDHYLDGAHYLELAWEASHVEQDG